MKKTTRLKRLIEDPALLVMPGAFDPLSAKLIEEAGFAAVQCSGLAIAANHLGLPDASILSMREMAERTRVIAAAVDLPVMADGDTGFGNAVNVWYTVRELEAAGAAGVNLEDQVMPKRCGHLDGKEVVALEEMTGKIAAAVDARTDPDFVLNARTDALAVHGLDETIRRGRAYLEAGATMVFVDGVTSREEISALVAGLRGPLAINMVEGGKTPKGLSFAELERMGVARVSLPVSTLLGAIRGMQRALERIRAEGGTGADPDTFAGFDEAHRLARMDEVYALERRFLGPDRLAAKYGAQTQKAS